MIGKIKENLNNYLEFNSNKLFNNTDYLVVFGGAIRDIVANDENDIKDIDIMCLPKSKRKAYDILISEGYRHFNLFSPDVFLLYQNIKCIFEPKTFVKNNKIVQLITPRPRLLNKKIDEEKVLIDSFFNILMNVDSSSSGLVFDGEELFETVKNSYQLCKNKKFITQCDAEMYNKERIDLRKNNLIYKGWKEIRKMNDIKTIRMLKILSLKNKHPFINELIFKLK